MSALRKESVWNMHQSWFFTTQGQNDEDVDRLRARQKEHYEVLRDSEEGEEKWDIMRQYYIETAAGVESGPKSSVGRVMAARDAFVKRVAAFCCLQNLHIFGFVIHTGVEEDSRQASGRWAGSPLLVPHSYVKRSILWKRLCHEAENLHLTILNWPEEVPVPDTQFDFHKLDANEPEGEDDGENSKGKEKGKGKKGKGKAIEEPYVPQDGDDLAFMAWPRDIINIYRQASKILLTIGGLHGKKPLASIVDEHNKDVIDEEWPGLAIKDTGFRNADNSDSARNTAHQANHLPPSTSDHDGCSIERPHSSSHHRVLDHPRSPHRHHSPPPHLPPPEHHHSPHQPPDRLAPASRQKRGRIDVDVDSS
ncbi:hypothetical protein PAXINDRAFT_14445 [Paxillus involutus ATCC 200175]|uniref:Uncharacterized protein n=1 Tax=Paxillus involutus ATCC 200175 TaxID=664439 RepID=A0A0C9TQF5_PAXIN|nr:hypothetical protein PAXINDRAFT_14445 [Paxillus involutus ATCC 200175]